MHRTQTEQRLPRAETAPRRRVFASVLSVCGLFIFGFLFFPSPVFAQAFINPITNPGPPAAAAGPVGAIIDRARLFLLALVTPLALLAIVYGGVSIILGIATGEGDKKTIIGKKIVTAAVLGLAITLAPLLIIDSVTKVIAPGTSVRQDPLTRQGGVLDIIENTVNFLLGLVSVMALAAVIYGGVLISSAAGDESRAKSGKKAITYGLGGMILALLSFTIIWLILFVIF